VLWPGRCPAGLKKCSKKRGISLLAGRRGKLKIEKIGESYSAEVDEVDKGDWSQLLNRFEDASIYQTWSYGSIRWGDKNLSHLVLKKQGNVVAAAQVRIIKVPFLKSGVAHIRWGPLWRIRGEERELENLREIVKSLREEYVVRSRLFLRVIPNEIEDGDDVVSMIYRKEGFRWTGSSYRTLLLDLTKSVDELRSGLRRKWRQSLGYGEKRKLEVIEGSNEELYGSALKIYEEMVGRKKFEEFVDQKQLKAIQRDLPKELKMNVMICQFEGVPVAAIACSAIGDTGLPLLAATGGKALKLNASYVLWWRMMSWLKEYGCQWLDVGGIDPDKNPGGYTFKSGLANKYGKDIEYIGQFDACESHFSRILFKFGEVARSYKNNFKSIFDKDTGNSH